MASELAEEFVFGTVIDDERLERACEQGDSDACLILARASAASRSASAAACASLSANAACRTDVIRDDLNALQAEMHAGTLGSQRLELINHRREWLAADLTHADQAIASRAASAFSEAVAAAKAVGQDYDRLASSLLLECRHLEALSGRQHWTETTPVHLKALQFHSCFVSYSVVDEQFATKLYSAIADAGVSCWKWNHDARTGRPLWGEIAGALRQSDKVVLVASKSSLQSASVIHEMAIALDSKALLPIYIDDYLFDEWKHPYRYEIMSLVCRDGREWRDALLFQKLLDRLLLDLRFSDRPAVSGDLSLRISGGIELKIR